MRFKDIISNMKGTDYSGASNDRLVSDVIDALDALYDEVLEKVERHVESYHASET